MTQAINLSKKWLPGRAALLISTLLIVNVLFFIDEGYYDLRWMHDTGNWIVFFIYTIILLAPQLLLHELMVRLYKGRGRVALSLIFGLTMGFVVLYKVVSGN